MGEKQMVTAPRLRTTTVEYIQSLDLTKKTLLPRKYLLSGSYKSIQVLSRQIRDIDILTAFENLEKNYIEKIVHKLIQLDGIESVKPIFSIPGNYHAVTFQIKLLNSINPYEEYSEPELNPERIERILEEARSLVSHECRMLRNTTNERYYFRTELVSAFDDQKIAVL